MSYFQVASGDIPASIHMNTAINQGISPFTDASARDTAYAGIGGPQPGTSCWLNDLKQLQTWNGSFWVPWGGRLPMTRVLWGALNFPVTTPYETILTGGNVTSTPDGPTYDPATGRVSHQVPGMYNMTFSSNMSHSVEVFLWDESNVSAMIAGSWGGTTAATGSMLNGMVYLGPGQTYIPKIYTDVVTTPHPTILTYLTFSYIGDFDPAVARGVEGMSSQVVRDRFEHLHPQAPNGRQ